MRLFWFVLGAAVVALITMTGFLVALKRWTGFP